ncbi:immunity protein SdpI [Ruminiclostridium hungatei]|uniref:Immunity protein SdpI n=1 Tax=Ruminiclostridium hungatei TaxID=48256 RepID=A0A1V4SFF4_RUMHU|nr:SdpI family protein [Ruminiclostridium hungatei]OPX42473.1 immunity protein SdpI [Ruminiclostridium hungatei]
MKNSKVNLLNIFFFAVSVLIIITGIFSGDNAIAEAVIPAVILIALVVIDIKAPAITRLSEENPKVKTFRLANRIAAFVILLIVITVRFKLLDGKLSDTAAEQLKVAAISVFMLVFGNLAPKIPFNRYLGLRLPWTVRDEATWRLAHKLVGYTAFPLAVIQFVLSFFIKAETVVPVCILLWVAIPGLYSGWYFYKKFN